MTERVLNLNDVGLGDIGRVGGKNASLGEMRRHLTAAGVRVPPGFATTADAYREFLAHDGLAARIARRLATLDIDDTRALAAAGAEVRHWILATPLPPSLTTEIEHAYRTLIGAAATATVAVRSSATAEDLPQASFAGQQETFLHVRGLPHVLAAIGRVFASLYNDRAIAYRVHHGFGHDQVALSAGVQRMVRTDNGVSGVMFTLDTESGFGDVVFITAAYGLGEAVVQGAVNPDEFYVHKPTRRAGRDAILLRRRGDKAIKLVAAGDQTGRTRSVDVPPADRRRFSLSDAEILALADQALAIEAHYRRPMDIEWGKDGDNGELYILQARPETVSGGGAGKLLQRFTLQARGPVLTQGRAIGARIGVGRARVIASARELHRVEAGDVLVTDMTDPDWEPVMKRAAAIVTDRGGRTCHAAIVARELGTPAVVGCGDASAKIADGAIVTVSCAEGDAGFVYDGKLQYTVRELSLTQMPPLPVKLMLNVGNPERAFDFQWLPNHGVGLARLEFIISQMIGVHPQAVLNYDRLPAAEQQAVAERAAGYADPRTFYVEKLSEGIAMLAAAFHPKPVIVRLSDFKSNEYANLLGGAAYEPKEENPMLGFRGAARYLSAAFRDSFALECRALKIVRERMGFANVEVMVPFVRTVAEVQAVVELLAQNGLRRGEHGLRLIMMCEIPSNALLADRFLDHVDGFSIGSNDLTQLTLGLDRDSALVAGQFDERDPAVLALLEAAIKACRRRGKYIGICGQGPSDHPDFARWLMAQGIDSVSLNPDTVVDTWLHLAKGV